MSVTISDITQSQDISQIVQSETTRLDKEKTGLDSEIYTRDRAVRASQSYSKKAQQYAYMFGVVVGALVICVVLSFAKIIIPSFLCDIGIILSLVVGFVWAYYIWMDIISRDASDFEQINPNKLINPDKLINPASAADIAEGKTGTGQSITSPTSACNGSDCCDESQGTKWDVAKLKCVPVKTVSSFTPIEVAHTSSALILPQNFSLNVTHGF